MTPAELHKLVYSLPYTTQEVAEKIGVTRGHLYNCMSGGSGFSPRAEMLLNALVETNRLAAEHAKMEHAIRHVIKFSERAGYSLNIDFRAVLEDALPK